MALIAFDIGGTQIKFGLVERDGRVLSAALYDTPKQAGGEGLVAALIHLAQTLQQQQPVEGIAISSFGLIDAENGVVLGAAEAVPGYTGTAVKAALQAALGLPVSIDNDVNCVALAEGWRGAAQQVRHYIAVAIGTGIGGGIVLNGQIYRGHRAAAGEWGYMWIDGLVWEDHASMRGLVNAVNADLQTQLDGRAIFARYDAGDVAIVPHVERWFGLLGKGLANLIYAFNPQRLVIGGGITARGDAFHRQLQAAVQAALQPDFQQMTELVLASAGNHAGMIGAVRNWLDEHARD